MNRSILNKLPSSFAKSGAKSSFTQYVQTNDSPATGMHVHGNG